MNFYTVIATALLSSTLGAPVDDGSVRLNRRLLGDIFGGGGIAAIDNGGHRTLSPETDTFKYNYNAGFGNWKGPQYVPVAYGGIRPGPYPYPGRYPGYMPGPYPGPYDNSWNGQRPDINVGAIPGVSAGIGANGANQGISAGVGFNGLGVGAGVNGAGFGEGFNGNMQRSSVADEASSEDQPKESSDEKAQADESH